jgi:MFS family permease
MAGEASETSPLLKAANGSVGPEDNNAILGADLERHTSIDSSRAAQFAGNEQLNKQLKRYIFPALSIGVFLSAADQMVIASSYGKIGSELKALNLTSWVATAYFLSLTSFAPLYGKLSDIFGRKACLLFAYSVFGLGSLFCGLSNNIYQLIAARVFQGIGGGGMNIVTTVIISDIVPLKNRGLWQGIINIIYTTGASVGAPLGGFFSDSVGWRWVFLVQPPMCAVAVAAVALTLRLPKTDDQKWKEKLKRIDFLGSLTLVCAILGLIFGLDRGSNVAWHLPISYVPLILSVPFLGLFVLVESKVAIEPALPGRIVFNRSLLAAYFCNACSIGGWLALYYYIPLFYIAVNGLSATAASLRLIPAVIMSTCGSLSSGWLMKRTGKYYWLTVMAYNLVFIGALVVFLSTGTVTKIDWLTTFGLIVGAFGTGTGVTTSLIAIISNAGAEDQAMATACSYLFRQLGTVIAISASATAIQQRLRTSLSQELGGGEDAAKIEEGVRQSLDLLKSLPPAIRLLVRKAYGDAVRHGFGLMLGITVGAALSSFFIREKRLSR